MKKCIHFLTVNSTQLVLLKTTPFYSENHMKHILWIKCTVFNDEATGRTAYAYTTAA